MEYVQGEDLRSRLARERTLSAPHGARIALAVCEGLAAAHAAGVVHRDLKPANVLLESEGRVVLTDFGIARALAREAASSTQGAIGTPMYMAPEQVAGEPVDARADLYAVGLLLYEMLTGQLPFGSDEPWAVAMARLRQPAPDLRQHPGIPAPLAELVNRCRRAPPRIGPRARVRRRGSCATGSPARDSSPSRSTPAPSPPCSSGPPRPARPRLAPRPAPPTPRSCEAWPSCPCATRALASPSSSRKR
ncbi:serine/threonine-protein kinase [Cystobacter fuscus]